ncbi:hypothetical protein [Microbacterium trichothecenolyticum]|nr:hypothetical protein [Microbacterium trichothecenolyticum]
MRPDTRNDDNPTTRHWVIAFAALLFVNIIAPALAAAVDLVHP